MQKLYTIGEIYRLKLLKNWKGEPYSDKATISKIVNKMKYIEKDTPWAKAKCLTKKQIDDYNKKRILDETN